MPGKLITGPKAKNNKRRTTRRKRKSRINDDSDDQYETDMYSARVKRQNISRNDFDQKEVYIGDNSTPDGFQIPQRRLTREEKKLQYYLDTIKKQEEERLKKSEREANKLHPCNRTLGVPNSQKVGEPKEPLRISLAKDYHPVLQSLSVDLDRLVSNVVNEPCIKSLKYDLDPDHYYKEEEGISCTQSEDQNESTFDNQRTPTLKSMSTSSIANSCDIENGGEALLLTNEMEKSSSTLCEIEPKTENLHQRYTSMILHLTLQKQKEGRTNHQRCFL
ncbi:unnamed protein product [Moneuplotes crassus]|uniref:Uncharacterized protein n=1 Tax=Euplotes crassus TaxID=5936 RepID=A0AAD1XSJ9_EUPCR|nr:unnamed protein product [Moneuplotes crassus]